MYCMNCGNKVDDNAYICVNCGVVLKKRSEVLNTRKKRKSSDTTGIASIILGSFALLCSLALFFNDISSVGMYTEVYERIFFALGYTLVPILFSMVTLILSLIHIKSSKNEASKVGLFLSLSAFFLILTEFVVVVIY